MTKLLRYLKTLMRLLPLLFLAACTIEEEPPCLLYQDGDAYPGMGFYEVSLTLDGGTKETGMILTVTSSNLRGVAELYDGGMAVGMFLDEKEMLHKRLTVEEDPIGKCYYQMSTGKDAIGLDVYLRLNGTPKIPVNVSWAVHKDGLLLGSGQKTLPDGNSNLTLCASQMLGLD